MARVIFHIDLNAFFTSAEELRHPEYKGKPLAVGSVRSRGVIATANYAAREKGIHSAMPTAMAKKLDENLVILPNDHEYYRKLSQSFFNYLKKYSTAMEVVSIDECYLDVTDVIRHYKRPMDLAVEIQQGVYRNLGLSCSIGVAPTKFLAKIASDLRKPMGISIIRKSEIKNKLWPLPIEKMLGIGKKTLEKVQKEKIETIGDLADPDNRSRLEPILKSSYSKMMDQVYGRSTDKLSYSTSRKSISRSQTFLQDIYTPMELYEPAEAMARDLMDKMKARKTYGRHVAVILKDIEFQSRMHSVTLEQPVTSYESLINIVKLLIDEHFEPVGYRLLGITIGSFAENAPVQASLFEPESNPTERIMEQFNLEFDQPVLKKASDLLKEKKDG